MPGGRQSGCQAERASVKKASLVGVPCCGGNRRYCREGSRVCVVGGGAVEKRAECGGVGGVSVETELPASALRPPERVFRFQATLLNTETVRLRIECYLGS